MFPKEAAKNFFKLSFEVVLLSICWLFLLFVIPPVTLTFSAFGIAKWTIDFIVERRHPDWVPLTALDLVCSVYVNSFDAETCSNNVGFVLVIDNDTSIKEVRSNFATLVLEKKNSKSFEFDRLQKLPVKYLGNYYWKPIPVDNKNLKCIIWERECASKTDFSEFLANWLELGFRKNGPLWEAVVYKDDDEYRGKTVFAFKMSHALGDGITIQKMAQAISIQNQTIKLASSTLQNNGSKGEKLNLMKLIWSPIILLKQVSPVFLHSDPIVKSKKSQGFLLTFATIDKEQVRSLARLYHCKFNDVLLSLWSNALRRFLLDSKLVSKMTDLPKTIPVVFPRAILDRCAAMSNMLAVAVLEVEIRNPSREEKLSNLAKLSNYLRNAGVYRLIEILTSLLYVVPLFFIATTEKFNSGITTSLSGFPLPDFQTTGRKIFGKYTSLHFYTLQQLFTTNFGFTCSFVTGNGNEVDVTIAGNKGIAKEQSEIDKFKFYLAEELKLMTIECLKKASSLV